MTIIYTAEVTNVIRNDAAKKRVLGNASSEQGVKDLVESIERKTMERCSADDFHITSFKVFPDGEEI